MHARIGMLRALDRRVERVLDRSRKDRPCCGEWFDIRDLGPTRQADGEL
jgi:hypothetical protein